MATKNFTTRTASLRATIADVRVLDAKKINLSGKNILDYIKESVPTITHSKDTRETVYENDLWGQWVETKADGTVVVHDDYLSNPNGNSAWNSSVKSVKDNKAYTSTDATGEPLCNIQTEMIKDGSHMFKQTEITSFSGDLSSLVNGYFMFSGTSITSFDSDLSSLVSGYYMFNGSIYLTSFSGDLSSLVDGSNMFNSTSLTSFSGDLSSLVNGSSMFRYTSLASFSGDLSSLVNGSYMFARTSLTPQSVMYIVESIRNITEEKAKCTSGEIPWVTYNSSTQKYSAPFGFMENGNYVYTYKNPNPYTTIISPSNVGKLTLGINVTNNSNTIDQQLQTFAKGCLCDSWDELKQEFTNKGWTVTFQYGGTSSSITLSEDEQFRGTPVYARLIEVSEEDKDKAEYCTEDGTKFYNIDWGHDVTDYDAYQYFGSLLEACGYYNVIPKKFLEEQA